MENFLRYLAFVLIVGGANAQSSLPACEGKNHLSWNNCYGTNEVKDLGVYSCERKDGQCIGKGLLVFANGKRYFGDFNDGMRTGKGTLYDSRGSVISDGIWDKNQFIGGDQQPILTKQDIEKKQGEIQDPTVACMEELITNPDFQGLYKKMPLDIRKGQSLEILSNNTKASAIEKKSILKFMDSFEACSNLGSEWRSKNYPLVIINLAESFKSETKILTADLYAGKLSFGELAKMRTKMMTEYLANLQSEVAKIKEERAAYEQALANKAQLDLEKAQQNEEARKDRNAQLAAQREALRAQNEMMAEQARRQAILQYIQMNPPKPFQPLPMPREPVTTNCNAYGNQWNCVTR